MDVVKFEDIEDKIVEIGGEKVILDCDVAIIYGVETKRINEAVKNNPDKFPDGYMLFLTTEQFADLRSNFSTTKFSKTRILPKAFTEKGLYMLATILKSPKAVHATFAIIETFAKFRQLSRGVKQLSTIKNKAEQKSLTQKSGELIAEILDDDLKISDSETSIELNLAVLKFRHTVKKKK